MAAVTVSFLTEALVYVSHILPTHTANHFGTQILFL